MYIAGMQAHTQEKSIMCNIASVTFTHRSAHRVLIDVKCAKRVNRIRLSDEDDVTHYCFFATRAYLCTTYVHP